MYWLNLENRAFLVAARDVRCLCASAVHASVYTTRLWEYAAAHDLIENPDFYTCIDSNVLEDWSRLSVDSAGITDGFLNHLARVSPKFSHVSFVCGYKAVDEGMRNFLSNQNKLLTLKIDEIRLEHEIFGTLHAEALERIDLQLYVRNTDWNELIALAESHRKLRSIAISLRGLTLAPQDAFFQALNAPIIEDMEFNNLSLSIDTLASFLQNAKSLKRLKLTGGIQLDVDVMRHLAELGSLKLKILDLRFQITPPMLTYRALQHLPLTLECLRFQFGPSNRQMIVNCLQRLPLLRDLKYHTEFFNDALIWQIIGWCGKQLHTADFGLCENLTDEGFRAIVDHCPHLVCLYLHSDVNRTNRVFFGFSLISMLENRVRAENLRVIYLSYFRQLVPEALMAIALNCTGLRELYLASVRSMNDHVLRLLAEHVPNLHTLNVQGCWSITDAGIESISHLRLLSLNIAMCIHLTNRSLVALAENCLYLHTLVCHGLPQVSPPTIQRVKESVFPRLRNYLQHWLKPNLRPNARFLNRTILSALRSRQSEKLRKSANNSSGSGNSQCDGEETKGKKRRKLDQKDL